MNIDITTSPSGSKIITACHDSGKGKASMWVIDGREYNTTYTGPLSNADDCLKALTEWLDENGGKS